MAVEYLGLEEISGPLVVLEGISDPSFEEIVEITLGGKKRTGRIIEISGDKVIVQVFENTIGHVADQHQNPADGQADDAAALAGKF